MDGGRRQTWVGGFVLYAGALAAVVALALSTGADRSAAAVGPYRCGRFEQAPRTATLHQLRTSVLCLVNRARERHGVPPLSFNADLRRSATDLSAAMVRSGSFSHDGPEGSTVLTRIIGTGYLSQASLYRIAENIAAGEGRSGGSPLAVVRDWMHSPEHRRNILDRALRDFGVGVARGDPFGGTDNSATYTLDFGTRRHR